MPVPTCCKLHSHNYTCIPILLRNRGTPDPTGQLIMVFSVSDVCMQHDLLLWCFQYQIYVYSMISYYGVFSIRRMYTAWSVIMVFSVSDLYMTVHSMFSYCPRPWRSHWGNIEMLGVRPCGRPSVTQFVSAITSDFMHRFTQYWTQWCILS